MSHNIAAFTATEGYTYYPKFISINWEDTGMVSVTVRAKEKEDGSCGESITVELTPEQWSALRASL